MKEHLEEATSKVSVLQAENETLKSELQQAKKEKTPPRLSEFFTVVDNTKPEQISVCTSSILSLLPPTTQHTGVQTTGPFQEVDENMALPTVKIYNDNNHSKSKISNLESENLRLKEELERISALDRFPQTEEAPSFR